MTASAHQRLGSGAGAGAGAGAPWSGGRSVDVASVTLGATDGRDPPPGRFLLMEITHVSCRSAVGTAGRGRSRWWRRAGAHSTGTRQGGGAAGTADSTRGLPHRPCVVHAGALDGREAGNAGSRDQQEKGPSSGTRPRGRRGDEPRGPGRLVTRRLRKTPRTGNGRGRSYRVPQRREDTRPETTMAATQSARSMSLASFRAGHAVRVDAERAERGGSQPAARNPAQRIPPAEPRDRIFRPVPALPAPAESRRAGVRETVRVRRLPAYRH